MAMQDGFWQQAATWFAGAVATLASLLWARNNKELENRRQGEIALHTKIEVHERHDDERFQKLADRIQQNHNEVMNHLIRLSKGD